MFLRLEIAANDLGVCPAIYSRNSTTFFDFASFCLVFNVCLLPPWCPQTVAWYRNSTTWNHGFSPKFVDQASAALPALYPRDLVSFRLFQSPQAPPAAPSLAPAAQAFCARLPAVCVRLPAAAQRLPLARAIPGLLV